MYLNSFTLPSAAEEDDFLFFSPMMDMSYYSLYNYHPFRFFTGKGLHELEFEPITVLYGGNGSGKTTLLNLISLSLDLNSSAPMNLPQYINEYVEMCKYETENARPIPRSSKLITSEDVFNHLLDIRSINAGVVQRREELLKEYSEEQAAARSGRTVQMRTFDDLDRLKRRNEVNHSTRASYVSKRVPKELCSKSNGESAYLYFTQEIKENALYLLDEPENSLSPMLQLELKQFIEDSVRFYKCQFIISSHSPFLLSMRGARVYDLDSQPVSVKKWTELESVRLYRDFFEKNREQFER